MRTRPAAAVTEGFTEDRLSEIAIAATGRPEAQSVTFQVSLDINPLDPEMIEGMASIFSTFLEDGDWLLIDMNFDRTVLRGLATLDILLHRALIHASEAVKDSTRILVLIESLPTPADSMHELLDDEVFQGRLLFVDAQGEHLGEIGGFSMGRLAPLLRSRASDVISDLLGGTLRRRGIFESETSSNTPSHHLFYYDISKSAHDSVIHLVAEYLRENRIDIVIFDSRNAGTWFRSCIAAACLKENVASLDSRSLVPGMTSAVGDSESETVARASRLLDSAESRVCFAVPAYKTGRTLFSLFEQSGRGDIQGVKFLSVLFDAEGHELITDVHALIRHANIRHGGKDLTLDYVLPVPIRVLRTNDWKIQAARMLGETYRVGPAQEDAREIDGPVDPTRVALWSLLEDYGNHLEDPVPEGRAPVRHFPALSELDDWDAHWLAELCVRRILEMANCAREALLIVLPDERSAARVISRSLKSVCRTAVMTIARDVIDEVRGLSEGEREKLIRHRTDAIAVLDESAVTHGTLTRLGDLIEDSVGRPPNLFGVVVDLGVSSSNRRQPYFSLMAWESLRFGAMRGTTGREE